MTESPPALTEQADKLAPVIHAFEMETAAKVEVIPSRSLKVFIGLATRDWMAEVHTSESVRKIGQMSKHEIHVRVMMNDGIARARNNLMSSCVADTDCDVLKFLDSDIIEEPRHFDRIVETAYARGICGGLYPKKQAVLDWVVNWLPGETPDAEGYCKAKHVGTGAMAISRKMITDFIAKHPEITYRGDPSPDAIRHDIFPMHAVGHDTPYDQIRRVQTILRDDKPESLARIIETLKATGAPGEYKSEDWRFCELARESGWDVWVDTRSQLRHVGKCVYPLQFTLNDDDIIDLLVHRYHIEPDLIRTFIASGAKTPGLMGGHREIGVRHWPREFPVPDLFRGEVLGGCYDVPYFVEEQGKEFAIIDIGADVGSFARWASKKWPKCPVHSYEWRAEYLPSLKTASENIAGMTVYAGAIEAANIGALPVASVIKIDAEGKEREIIEALAASGRVGEFDAIMIKYYDELTAYFLKQMVTQTHFTHCFQRFGDNVGIVKFLRRQATITEGVKSTP